MPPTRPVTNKVKNEILGVALLALALLFSAGIYATATGWMNPSATIGALGNLMVKVLEGLTGQGKFMVPLFLTLWGLRLIVGAPGRGLKPRLWGSILFLLVLLTGLHQPLVPGHKAKELLALGLTGQGGGVVGGLMSVIFMAIFGRVGTWIVLGATGVIAFLLFTGISLQDILTSLVLKFSRLGGAIKQGLVNFLYTEVEVAEEEEEKKIPPANTSGHEAVPVIVETPTPAPFTAVIKEEPVQAKVYPETPLPPVEEESRRRRRSRVALPPVQEPLEEEGLDNYVLPPLSLLHKPAKIKNPRLEKDIGERIKILEDTLESFGVKVKVTQVSCGPAVTRYEVQPAPGIKVSRIVSLADDIALSLAAPQVRIEAPIPGKAAIGIEVPNKEVAIVHLREVLETPAFTEATSKLTLALGKDIAGNPVIADLAKMPHLLIAGATGSGKSVCLNALICSMLFKAKPHELKFLMIDPKMVELTQYNGIPHLLAPVVSHPKKAAAALHWMVNEMEKRYELFAAAGVKDINRYNRWVQRENVGREFLPLVVVVIDELADLMMVAPADVEDAICRLAQMARAAGIHLVVATQRPSVDVITGLIKANISARIAFAVSSQIDSRTILDMAGAEKLLGRGDMLFLPTGATKPIRVQGAYVSDREVEDLVTYIKQQGRPEYNLNFLKEEETVLTDEEEDELLPAAVRVVLETGQASISMLQRRLRVGYARAARLMDMMEARGFVGGPEGTKPRAILINWEEYRRLFGEAGES
ncbi:DNA translocase FtsK [Thermanaeromonas toyohensis ToBE]|uniref:DNA translocase FtsK n=1 Tax=Thermanaeromonas toyohensis ToBE TaxID=698762 RepID=A0A1W1VUW3_9FIRM|nr:DNA translocase FtsK [Thermanaeromonas toyohensis]SMB97167.1 DNA translocase FtsK [Thermanaeromonas toyohensis ToBE]